MARFVSESDEEYGYDLTASDEERLIVIVNRLSSLSPRTQSRSAPSLRHDLNTPTSSRASGSLNQYAPSLDSKTAQAVDETLAGITESDLDFDITELDKDDSQTLKDPEAPREFAYPVPRDASAVSRKSPALASYVIKAKTESIPSLLPGPDVTYPDLSWALAELEKHSESSVQAAEPQPAPEDRRSTDDPKEKSLLLRFRTFPKKPLSVSDLVAGSWCELQYYYTLTRLPGGKRTRTIAMKRGSAVHKMLEEELWTPVHIEVTKKEDVFGLKIWNIIQGLRVLREQGITREFEVWGIVDGNVVNGVIDGLSYDNPDPELEQDVLSSREGSQTVTDPDSQTVYRDQSTLGSNTNHQIFITDVKTRTTATPPPKAQVRGAIIQLFLYHRFLSEMAAQKLDYSYVFSRYGLNPDEPFSDSFMAQIGKLYEEIFQSSQESFPNTISKTSRGSNGILHPVEGLGNRVPSKLLNLSQLSLNSDETGSEPEPSDLQSGVFKYNTLRSLVSILQSEIALTFPNGANDLGKIVAVEYRYRRRHRLEPEPDVEVEKEGADGAEPTGEVPLSRAKRRRPPSPKREDGEVICTNTFFVEPEKLDMYLQDTMRWWRGERDPRGVPVQEAFKCRTCEFADVCGWRKALEEETLERLGSKHRAGEDEDKETRRRRKDISHDW